MAAVPVPIEEDHVITLFTGCAEMTESMRHKMQQLKRQVKGR